MACILVVTMNCRPSAVSMWPLSHQAHARGRVARRHMAKCWTNVSRCSGVWACGIEMHRVLSEGMHTLHYFAILVHIDGPTYDNVQAISKLCSQAGKWIIFNSQRFQALLTSSENNWTRNCGYLLFWNEQTAPLQQPPEAAGMQSYDDILSSGSETRTQHETWEYLGHLTIYNNLHLSLA